ncbi:Protein-disulfide isomerase [Roseivivax lentus]|uniref:Protein-disulfide isomerase n=1 Tax=Roseivivax lentus TaxID=633194 RepID=A0A1N7LVL2_9RHOB|nr:DsbA family protein [Roseivivax lentus]SIS77731.1 Protein-disulfide isomerase [Roseivivax lentus]
MFKSALTALALVTAGATGAYAQGFDITDMSDAERDAFRAELRDYLMENPQVIIEAVNALEARQAAEAEAAAEQAVTANAAAIKNDGVSWVGGNPEGDITVVEFMDYRCGYCRRAAPEVEELVASDGNIRFVIKEFPILGEASMTMSRFAIATQRVAGDEAYKQVHDTLMALSGEPTEPVLRRIAEEFLLDGDAILAEMNSDSVTRQIAETRALAETLQIRGTPTFVMGDALVRGYVTLDEMRDIVSAERSDG